MDISLIEFIVYGLVAYTGVVLLIISAFRETPDTKSQSIVRAMYLSMSIIACVILSGSGVDITMPSDGINSVLSYNVTDGTLLSNSTSIPLAPATFTLINPVWIMFHYMLAAVMLVYVILQILILLTKT